MSITFENTDKKRLIVFIFLASLLLYSRTINFGFVWDDERIHLTVNKSLMKGDITSFWEKPYSGMYIPVTYSIWTLTKSLFYSNNDLSPEAFHCLNILTHSVNCILVLLILLNLFNQKKLAVLGTLIFMIHPLQVESVAWISEFRGLISAMFGFCSILSVLSYANKSGTNSNTNYLISVHFLTTTICIVLAVLSKPSAVMIPFIITMLIWCFHRELIKNFFASIVAWIIMIIPIVYLTSELQPENVNLSLGFYDKVLISGHTLFFYLSKLLLPYPIAACYGFTPSVILGAKFIVLTFAIGLLCVLLIFKIRHRYAIVFCGFMILLLSIAPVLGFISFKYQGYSSVADRYVYFGMFGVSLVCAFLISIVRGNKLQSLLVYSYIFILLFLNIKQTTTWKDEFSVWDHTLTYYQNSAGVYYNRGVQYSIKHKFNDAIQDYTNCLRIDNSYKDALFNRANAYENLGNYSLALSDYNYYLSKDSTDGSVYYKRAFLNYRMGNLGQATLDAKKAELNHFPIPSKLKKQIGL